MTDGYEKGTLFKSRCKIQFVFSFSGLVSNNLRTTQGYNSVILPAIIIIAIIAKKKLKKHAFTVIVWVHQHLYLKAITFDGNITVISFVWCFCILYVVLVDMLLKI